MFDTEKIARQALQRADETETKRRNTRRGATAILSVCAAGLGVFFLVFSTDILSPAPHADENAGMHIEDQQVPLAISPAQVQPGIIFGDSELTIISEGGAIQYSVIVVGDAEEYTFHMVDLTQEGGYTLQPIPDGIYRLMVGNIEIGTLTVTDGIPRITLG